MEDTFDSSLNDSLAFVSGSADLPNGLALLDDVSGVCEIDSTLTPEKRTGVNPIKLFCNKLECLIIEKILLCFTNALA